MVSKITIDDIANYIRLTELSDEDRKLLTNLKQVAIDFIKSYTGLADDKIDEHNDFVYVFYILCQDMWDNRTLYIEKGNLNKVVETILGMHCVNLL